jgi:hypothetical protein
MIRPTENKVKRLGVVYSSKQMMHGVFNTLAKRGFEKEQATKTVYDYIAHIGMDSNISVEDACVEVQKDFDSFIHFVREVQPSSGEYILKGQQTTEDMTE